MTFVLEHSSPEGLDPQHTDLPSIPPEDSASSLESAPESAPTSFPEPATSEQVFSQCLSQGSIGAVVIGRNEGDFLEDSLRAVVKSLGACQQETNTVVYVDSGSTDNSVAIAQQLNIPVIELSTDLPFTAARGYNTGFQFLRQRFPDLQFVQFVDGDCIMDPNWISQAHETLTSNPDVTIVCGHIMEKHRDQSPYNKLMDIDWRTPLGELEECAGNTLMRAECFEAVGGFDPKMMAGEEPELSLRIRRAGGKIVSIDAISVLHDARMVHFSQWWQRSRREGNAFAEAALMHGLGEERHRVRESLSILLWGCVLPLIALGASGLTHGWSLALGALYGIVWIKMALKSREKHNITIQDAALYATFCLLSKFPRFLGQLNFVWHAVRQKTPQLIEYRLGSFG